MAASIALAGGVLAEELAGDAASAPSPKQDARILEFFLLLERVQEGLYAAASKQSWIGGELRTFARTARIDEAAHVRLLEHELGGRAGSKARLSFDDAVRSRRRFVAAAVQLEEVATAAVIGESANLTPAKVTTAARIVAVDARHAAWIRDIARKLPAPKAADPSREAAEVAALLRRKGYVSRR